MNIKIITLVLLTFVSRLSFGQIFLDTKASAGVTACGDPVIFTIEVKNTGTTELKDVVVNSLMPEGINYVADPSDGTLSIPTPDPPVIPNNPFFTVGQLAVNETKFIKFKAKANCGLITYLTNNPPAIGNYVNNMTTAQYKVGTDPTVYSFDEINGPEESESYNAVFPNFLVEIISGREIVTSNRQTHEREIKITNTGFGAIKGGTGLGFTLDITNGSGVQFKNAMVGTTELTANISGNNIIIPFTDFTTLVQGGDNDEYFELNEYIIVKETVLVIACSEENSLNDAKYVTTYLPKWGCEGSACSHPGGTSSKTASIVVFKGVPLVSIQRFDEHQLTYCGNQEIQFEFKNVGVNPGAKEEDRAASLNLKLTEGVIPGFLQNVLSFSNFRVRYKDGSGYTYKTFAESGISAVKTNNTWQINFGTIDPDGEGGMSNLDDDLQFDDLPKNEAIVIAVTANVVCPAIFENDNLSYSFDVFQAACSYKDACEKPIGESILKGTTKNTLELSRIEGPTDLEPGSANPGSYRFIVRRDFVPGPMACTGGGAFYSDFLLPPGYIVTQALWKEENEQDVSLVINQNGRNLHLDGGGMNGEYLLKVVLNCEGNLTDPDSYLIEWTMKYQCSNTCTCEQKLVNTTYEVFNHCPECPGWHTTNFTVKRKTYGWPESSQGYYTNDELRVVPQYKEGITNPDIIDNLRLNAALETDVIELIATGNLDPEDPEDLPNTSITYDNAHVEIVYTSVGPENIFELLEASFIINAGTAIPVPASQLVNQPVSMGGNVYKYDFSVPTSCSGCPASFPPGTHVILKVKMKVRKTDAIPSGDHLIANFRALHYGIKPNSEKQACESFGDAFYIVKYKYLPQWTSSDSPTKGKGTIKLGFHFNYGGCDMHNPVFVQIVSDVPIPVDPFPGEFRPMSYLDNIIVEIPNLSQYTPNGCRIKYRNISGVESYVNLPPPDKVPGGVKWNKTKDSPIFDSGTMEFIFHAEVAPNCSHTIPYLIDINVTYDLYNYKYDDPVSKPYKTTNEFSRRQSELTLNTHPNQQTFDRTVTWPVFLKNLPKYRFIDALETIETDTWLTFIPANSNIELQSVVNPDGTPYKDPYGTAVQIVSYDPAHPERKLIKLGKLKVSTEEVPVRLVATYNACEENQVENVILKLSSSCDSYPANPEIPGCEVPPLTANLSVTYKTSGFDMTVSKLSPTSDFCEPTTFVFDVLSFKEPDIYDLEFFTKLPPGVSDPLNAQYEYPFGSGVWKSLPALVTNAKGKGWNLHQIPELNPFQGTHGVDPLNKNRLKIKFDLNTFCGSSVEESFDPGVSIRFHLFGTTNCGKNIGKAANKEKIVLGGVTLDQLDVKLTVPELTTCSPEIPVVINVKNIGTSQSLSDLAEITLPAGVEYVGGGNPLPPVRTAEKTILKWNINPFLQPQEEWTREIKVRLDANQFISGQVIELIARSSMPLTVTCVSDNQPCNLRASVEDVVEKTIVTEPVIPVIEIGKCTDLPVLAGQTIPLSVINPLPGATFEWDFNEDNVPDLITNNPAITHAFDKEGTFQVKVTMRVGPCQVTSGVKQVQVIKISLGATQVTICVGQTVKLNVSPGNFPASDYLWYQDGILLSSTGTDICVTQHGNYKVIIKSLSCVPDESYFTSGVPLPDGYYFASIEIVIKSIECGTLLSCDKCKPTFVPEPDKKYILTAWVREDAAGFIENYVNAGIQIGFHIGGSVDNSLPVARVKPDQPIIDGWQRIEYEFVPPMGTAGVSLSLVQSPEVDIYYDDIRVHPFDGNMKSFVYDPYTLRLMAVLDENNYATFYEYDQEGKLIRIKKETERGIMTIQENQNNIFKPE